MQTFALPLGHSTIWSGLRGSNSLPPPWQGGALPDELKPQKNGFASHFSVNRCQTALLDNRSCKLSKTVSQPRVALFLSQCPWRDIIIPPVLEFVKPFFKKIGRFPLVCEMRLRFIPNRQIFCAIFPCFSGLHTYPPLDSRLLCLCVIKKQ